MGEARLGVGVLRLEVAPDFRVLLLPQPVVVVPEDLSVQRVYLLDSLGDRGLALGLADRGQHGRATHSRDQKADMFTHMEFLGPGGCKFAPAGSSGQAPGEKTLDLGLMTGG